MAYTVVLSPVTGQPAEWRYWRNPNAAPSPGELLRRIEVLIAEAGHLRRDITEGKWVNARYLQELSEAARYCLADVGNKVQTELAEIASLDFSAPEGLAKFKPIVDGVWTPPDDSEYHRLQAEFDAKATAQAERFERVLCRARDKMLGPAPAAFHPPGNHTRRATGNLPEPYSERDDTLFKAIGAETLKQIKNSELWKRRAIHEEFQNIRPKASKAAFLASLYRIRRRHNLPAPRPQKI